MSQRIAAAVLGVATALLAAACKPAAAPVADAQLKTDLKDNDAVKETFDAWKAGSSHCRSSDAGKRAIVSGFGLFGDKFNISGVVAMSMAKSDFFPASVRLETDSTDLDYTKVWAHGETTTTNGAAVVQRSLEIDGEAYEVCFLLLDVKWDLAAAIILHEASLFRPQLVVMSGMNGAEATKTFFESGAVNNARLLSGFDSAGTKVKDNIPNGLNVKVLPDLDLDAEVALTWDASALVDATKTLIEGIATDPSYTAQVGPTRRDNNYICNNVSIVVTTGLSNEAVKLAGGKIELAGQDHGTKVGFLHYPSKSSTEGRADDGRQVYAWTKVLATVLKTSLGSAPAATP